MINSSHCILHHCPHLIKIEVAVRIKSLFICDDALVDLKRITNMDVEHTFIDLASDRLLVPYGVTRCRSSALAPRPAPAPDSAPGSAQVFVTPLRWHMRSVARSCLLCTDPRNPTRTLHRDDYMPGTLQRSMCLEIQLERAYVGGAPELVLAFSRHSSGWAPSGTVTPNTLWCFVAQRAY